MPHQHLIDIFRQHARDWADQPAQRVKVEGAWRDTSWAELGGAMDAVARGLIRLGHQPGDMVGLCARNMPEWTQADLGILAARGVTVPLYPNSTPDQAQFILRDAGIRILFAGEQPEADLGLRFLASGDIDHLIALDPAVDLHGHPAAMTFEALLALDADGSCGEALAERAANRRMDDLLTLVYTSGTTGEPKGVMLDHANLSEAMHLHDLRLKLERGDVSLAMLPLCHIFERAWTFYVLYRGAVNVYLRDPQTVIQIIGEVKPTHMCAVPRVYEKAFAGIHGRIAKAGWPVRRLFRWAMGVGTEVVKLRLAGRKPTGWLALKHRLAERLIFRKLRDLFGGRCRFFPVAGAALADDVNVFFQAIGLNLKYGYGLSETCATVSCYPDDTLPIGTLGQPLEGLEVKLGEDNEILVKGPTVMRGYWNRPEETAKAMTTDGFLRTGDAGSMDARGNLVFIERIKELMKTSNGKYIAPQRVEGTLGKDAFIDQIAIIADSRNFVSALIVPHFEGLEEHARSIGLKYRTLADLVEHSKVVEFFESRIQHLQKELAHFEQVKKFTLLKRPFSMEMGELTPTLKLRRKSIEAAFKAEIEAMYRSAKA
ncbi:long-chain fatty acid--CoA ligase [Geothrix sp. PMB-07]|uniref:AMP-dependent synthetase/ligase n=1 Tax=Geothrix sp. PMB-07 TaxID=3068640 RepID=UPI0027403941|nr:long-chain fatty acid--CoA ligase [Geothrix sp. PMB-07]WLT33445.1 long-chain fatty acid--CoA ligase [Geothrix sp. PMB-07]